MSESDGKSDLLPFLMTDFSILFHFNIEIPLDNDNVYIEGKPWKRNVE